MKHLRPKRRLIPAWDMPSDPVKAVFWFFHWLLQVLVGFFYIPILIGVTYEAYVNGIVGLLGTLLVGLGVWGGLALLLLFVNFSTGVSQTFADSSRLQKDYPPRRPFYNAPGEADDLNDRVVEGTVTNLEEERKKRRQDMH